MGLKFQKPSFNTIQNRILKQAKLDYEFRHNLVLNSIEKIKPGMLPESNETKF